MGEISNFSLIGKNSLYRTDLYPEANLGNFQYRWSPKEISAELWLDSSDQSSLVMDGTSVEEWKDKSGNNNHAIQTNSLSQPTIGTTNLNGLSVLDFSSSHLKVNNFSATQPYSFFIVAKTNNTDYSIGSIEYLIDGATILNRNIVQIDRFGKVQMYAGTWSESNLATPTAFCIISASFNTTTSTISLNGTRETHNVGTRNLSSGLTIGSKYNGTQALLDGSIAEIVAIDNDTSIATTEKMEGYLAHKWGTASSLTESHPYKYYPRYFI